MGGNVPPEVSNMVEALGAKAAAGHLAPAARIAFTLDGSFVAEIGKLAEGNAALEQVRLALQTAKAPAELIERVAAIAFAAYLPPGESLSVTDCPVLAAMRHGAWSGPWVQV